eukprot:4687060-Amphidinium_carterae.1
MKSLSPPHYQTPRKERVCNEGREAEAEHSPRTHPSAVAVALRMRLRNAREGPWTLRKVIKGCREHVYAAVVDPAMDGRRATGTRVPWLQHKEMWASSGYHFQRPSRGEQQEP